MKTWQVAAISALVLMGLMTWPFVKGHLGFGAQISANAPMGGDFELTRQDGRDMALSELDANQYWITFMEPTCQACSAELARVHQLGLDGLMVVISADPDLDPAELGRWVQRSAPNAVSFGGDRRDLARVIARYRLPAVPTQQGLDYPIRWYQSQADGELIQLHAQGFNL